MCVLKRKRWSLDQPMCDAPEPRTIRLPSHLLQTKFCQKHMSATNGKHTFSMFSMPVSETHANFLPAQCFINGVPMINRTLPYALFCMQNPMLIFRRFSTKLGDIDAHSLFCYIPTNNSIANSRTPEIKDIGKAMSSNIQILKIK